MQHSASQIARIRIELRHTKPRIWRRVDVPLSYTLMSLHQVIQVAFEWNGGHLFEFEAGGRRFGNQDDQDLFEADPFEMSAEDARKIRLHEIVEWGIKRFNYTYDFGDDWQHIITILRVFDATPDTDYPRLVAGARCAPFDDVGGVWGFYSFVEAAGDPNHPDREQYKEWRGEQFLDEFDPEEFDDELIRHRLAFLAQRNR